MNTQSSVMTASHPSALAVSSRHPSRDRTLSHVVKLSDTTSRASLQSTPLLPPSEVSAPVSPQQLDTDKELAETTGLTKGPTLTVETSLESSTAASLSSSNVPNTATVLNTSSLPSNVKITEQSHKVVHADSSKDNQQQHNKAVTSATPVTDVTTSSSLTGNLSTSSLPTSSTSYFHLRQEYMPELLYMLIEFQKLERQLLGARAATRESSESRERREKLHSFILHLEETISQIKAGCHERINNDTARLTKCSVVAQQSGTTKSPNNNESKNSETALVASDQGAAVANNNSESSSNLAATPGSEAKNSDEENAVQKLEEHILANLLPVKVRLKKQLAAQQGAKYNPTNMPVRGVLAATASPLNTSTTKIETRANAVKSNTPALGFDKPLPKHESTLAKTLHGSKATGALATTPSTEQTKVEIKPLYSKAAKSQEESDAANNANEGMQRTIDSKNLCANTAVVVEANSAHCVVIQDPALLKSAARISNHVQKTTPEGDFSAEHDELDDEFDDGTTSINADHPNSSLTITKKEDFSAQHLAGTDQIDSATSKQLLQSVNDAEMPDIPVSSMTAAEVKIEPVMESSAVSVTYLTDEQRRRFSKRKKRKKRQRELQQQQQQQQQQLQHQLMISQQQQLLEQEQEQELQTHLQSPATKRKKTVSAKVSKKRGPRSVEYMCALCNEVYSSTCDYNPWWALQQQDCPKCQKSQIPRVDIGAPANAIEYHPALLAHADENGGGGQLSGIDVMHMPPSHLKASTTFPATTVAAMSDSDSLGSDLSDEDWEGLLSDDDSLGSDTHDAAVLASLTPAKQAENELFGFEYSGPILSNQESATLLLFMGHASTCPGQHKSSRHRDVCHSTKWLMLHVRDCPGTTSGLDVCPFPWCRKVKHLLYHLVSCTNPQTCSICSPKAMNKNLKMLRNLNNHRFARLRERYMLNLQTSTSSKLASSVPGIESQICYQHHTEVLRAGASIMVPKSPAIKVSSSNRLCQEGSTASCGITSETDPTFPTKGVTDDFVIKAASSLEINAKSSDVPAPDKIISTLTIVGADASAETNEQNESSNENAKKTILRNEDTIQETESLATKNVSTLMSESESDIVKIFSVPNKEENNFEDPNWNTIEPTTFSEKMRHQSSIQLDSANDEAAATVNDKDSNWTVTNITTPVVSVFLNGSSSSNRNNPATEKATIKPLSVQ